MTRPLRVAHVTTVDLTVRFLLAGQLRRLQDEGYDVTAISAPGPWVAEIESDGIRHIPWRNATRSWSPATDAKAFAELLAVLRRERFDLVHTHNPKPGVIGRIAARSAGVPRVVNTVHGLYATPDDPLARRASVLALERLAARFSDLELYQSAEDLAWARRAGVVPSAKSRLIGNGVDLSRFDPSAVPAARVGELRAALGIPQDALVVGTVGRLVAEKGYRELFAAARDVRAAVPGARFLVVGGPDPEKADGIDEPEIAGQRDHVVFAGWRTDVADLLALMDVFVLASHREGLPRSAIEAAAMAKPLVLTDIRGCREVARDGVEGILVPPRDARRLGEALVRLLREPALREAMGRAARARAGERFDEGAVAGRVLDAYEELLRSKRGAARPERGAARPETGLRVRAARPSDAAIMSRLHRDALPEAFLPALGDRFLRLLYRALASDEEAVALVAENGAGVVGFAAGVPSTRAFYRRFARRHGVRAALLAAPRALRPGVLRRLRETARYPAAGPEAAELLSIGVAAGSRTGGVGRSLADGIVRGLAARGATKVRVVVGAGNEPANRFYERLGFEHAARIEVHEGVPSNVWVIPCPS